MIRYKMARIVMWFCVLVVVLTAQNDDNDKVDVKTFLENIKKMFQETVEKIKKQQQNRMKRRNDKKNKIKTREMLINKLANPYLSFRRQHTVIDYKKGPDTQSNRNNPQEKNNKTDGKSEGISNQTINKVLKSNPVFNPFSIDRLKDILNKIQRPQGNMQGNVQNSSTSSGNTEPDHQTLRYKEELYDWFREVYSKIQWFWDMVYRLFIVDEQRFRYLEEVLCKGEITTSTGWSYSSLRECVNDNLPARFRIVALQNRLNMPCESLVPQKLEVDTRWLGEVITCVEGKRIKWTINSYSQCTPSLYIKAKFIGDKGREEVRIVEGIRPTYSALNSLCYNLYALNFFAYKSELERQFDSDYISRKAKSFIWYVQFMGKIFKEKIIPTMADMCIVRCLCEDIGIGCTKRQQMKLSAEEIILLMAWNFLKMDIYVLISSLSKFGYGLKSISDECVQIKNEFKKIVKLEYIQNKLPELKELKNKIDEMESSGKIDTSYYEKLLKLATEVKRELYFMKESLIKLWEEKIEKIESVKDLKCVVESFYNFINAINVDSKNALELSWNNLMVSKDKVKEVLLKIISGLTTFDEVKSFLLSVGILAKNGIDRNIIDKVINTTVRVLGEELNNVSTIDELFEIKNKWEDVLNDFSIKLMDVSYNLFDVLKKGVELSSNSKIKAFMKLVVLTSYGSLYEEPTYILKNLFDWFSVLDYQIYIITELFNSVKCIINNISFINFLESSLISKLVVWSVQYMGFLEYFVMNGKKIGECDAGYGIIGVVTGKMLQLKG